LACFVWLGTKSKGGGCVLDDWRLTDNGHGHWSRFFYS
jgi:hypothetical protein